ncbi:MAG: hypothetical protein ABI895_15825 [Deltaproteobacteria bacterium]
MSLRPRVHIPAFAVYGALLSIFACTLSSDYEPPSLDGLQPALPAEQTAEQPLLPSGEPSNTCSAGGEISGCAITLVAGSSCASDLDCESQVCASGACAPASCNDGRENGGETGVDCGGACALACNAAAVSGACTADAECGAGSFCAETTLRCTPSACSDGIRNGEELEADCGGGACPGCPVGNRCNGAEDCLTGVCGAAGTCSAASCNDAVRNQNETGVDCGGSCPECGTGQPCGVAGDCQSGVCAGGCAAGIDRCCQAASCDDGVRNGNEPVTDCGNAACGGCGIGSPCGAGRECASGLCQAGSCQLTPCGNGVRSGSETDIDCGGNDPGCARCEVGDRCTGNADCASNSCVNGACADCGDGRRNGTEIAVDCGGVCGPCGPGDACTVDADCQSGVCEDRSCCGGDRVDCTRCARRLVTAINCNSNGPGAAPNCEAFLDCLADNPGVCPIRYAPGCSDEPGSVCDNRVFGGTTGPGVGLADAILGSAQCTF